MDEAECWGLIDEVTQWSPDRSCSLTNTLILADTRQAMQQAEAATSLLNLALEKQRVSASHLMLNWFRRARDKACVGAIAMWRRGLSAEKEQHYQSQLNPEGDESLVPGVTPGKVIHALELGHDISTEVFEEWRKVDEANSISVVAHP